MNVKMYYIMHACVSHRLIVSITNTHKAFFIDVLLVFAYREVIQIYSRLAYMEKGFNSDYI